MSKKPAKRDGAADRAIHKMLRACLDCRKSQSAEVNIFHANGLTEAIQILRWEMRDGN